MTTGDSAPASRPERDVLTITPVERATRFA
jgi:hypothetical protein